MSRKSHAVTSQPYRIRRRPFACVNQRKTKAAAVLVRDPFRVGPVALPLLALVLRVVVHAHAQRLVQVPLRAAQLALERAAARRFVAVGQLAQHAAQPHAVAQSGYAHQARRSSAALRHAESPVHAGLSTSEPQAHVGPDFLKLRADVDVVASPRSAGRARLVDD